MITIYVYMHTILDFHDLLTIHSRYTVNNKCNNKFKLYKPVNNNQISLLTFHSSTADGKVLCAVHQKVFSAPRVNEDEISCEK